MQHCWIQVNPKLKCYWSTYSPFTPADVSGVPAHFSGEPKSDHPLFSRGRLMSADMCPLTTASIQNAKNRWMGNWSDGKPMEMDKQFVSIWPSHRGYQTCQTPVQWGSAERSLLVKQVDLLRLKRGLERHWTQARTNCWTQVCHTVQELVVDT